MAKVRFLSFYWHGLFRDIKNLVHYLKVCKFSDPKDEKSKNESKTDF
jgi:hypothetical protein